MLVAICASTHAMDRSHVSMTEKPTLKKNILVLQEVKDDNKRSNACFSKLAEWLAPKKASKEDSSPALEAPQKHVSVSSWIQQLAEQEYLTQAVKINDYENIKKIKSQSKSFAQDASCNNLLQILLQAEIKPNLALVKHLTALTTFTHVNLDNKTVLDCLDLTREDHKECAPYIVGAIYTYIKRLPEFSDEDNLEHPVYAARWQQKTASEKIAYKYKIAKKYLDMIKDDN
jgi:hypothetical protein